MRRALLLCVLVGCQSAPAPEQRDAPIEIALAGLRVQMPARASGRLHVERSAGAWIDVEPIGLADAAGVRDGARVVYDNVLPGTRLTHLAAAGRVEEFRHVERAASSLHYRVHLGPKIARLRVVEDFVEALDDRGVALLRTEPAYLVDARGVRRDLVPIVAHDEEWTLDYAIDDHALVYPLEIDPAWTTTANLARARRDNSLHLLASGKVLAVGGVNITAGGISAVESWDPTTGSWTSAGSLVKPRGYHSFVTLASGKIFVAGGAADDSVDIEVSAEIYDPATATSTLLSGASENGIGFLGRAAQVSATKVLIAHDLGSDLVDLTTGVFTTVPYVDDRTSVTIASIGTGKLLLAGGASAPAGTAATSSAEIFDLATSKWTKTTSMRVARLRPEAVTLASGKVLVAGGSGLSSAELFDPATATWTATGSMTTIHAYNSMALLPSGKALNMGGDLPSGLTDRTDLYDPIAGTWTFAGLLHTPVDEFGFTVFPSGKVMIAGGSNGAPVPTSQIFDPLANGKSCLGAGECTSGFCVDGACCSTSSCATGKTCGGSGAPGTCLATDGSTCAADGECGSAHCVDGVCCGSACTDVCGACNLKGSEGTCIAVAAGDKPHGSRAACPGESTCQARCGGVDATKCTQFPGTPVNCAAASCTDGEETRPRGCDGAGTCAPGVTHACAPYVCDAAACKTTCNADADCATGNTCDLLTRKCVIAATCEGDQNVVSPDGKSKDCAPYRCAGGRCIDTCTDSSACAAGYLCDTSKCVRGAATESDAGGCTIGDPKTSSGSMLFALIALLGIRAGRRARRSISRPRS